MTKEPRPLARAKGIGSLVRFRVSGSKVELTRFSARFRSGEVVNLAKECLEPSTICGLLKEEIRYLPSSSSAFSL